MVAHRLKSQAERLADWRVAKKIKPGERGAIKLGRAYGTELLCVRYRENPEGTERLTTVELIVERVAIQKRGDPVVSFKLRHDELELRRMVMSRGGRYNGKNCMWQLRRSEVLRMGLKSRIASIEKAPSQEPVHP